MVIDDFNVEGMSFIPQTDGAGAFAPDAFKNGEVVAFADSENCRNLLSGAFVRKDANEERAGLFAAKSLFTQWQGPRYGYGDWILQPCGGRSEIPVGRWRLG